MAHENWTYKQLVVALRTYFEVPFNKANNSNSKIIEVSKIIGRSANSLKMKIGNFGSLDPELKKRGIKGLTGASNLDKEVWKEFIEDKEKLAYDSSIYLSEFLKKPIESVIELPKDEIIEGKEKLSLVRVRVNQYFFRSTILGIYDNTCCITGLKIPELLVASHIKPWALDKPNRLNPENGLCLNSIHDRAFDTGLVTITPDYKIKLSKHISEKMNEAWLNFFKQYSGKLIIMPERYFPHKDFLDFHNKTIFKK